MGIIGPIRECYADGGHGPLIVNNSNNQGMLRGWWSFVQVLNFFQYRSDTCPFITTIHTRVTPILKEIENLDKGT